jgi:hypothetical protein
MLMRMGHGTLFGRTVKQSHILHRPPEDCASESFHHAIRYFFYDSQSHTTR